MLKRLYRVTPIGIHVKQQQQQHRFVRNQNVIHIYVQTVGVSFIQ
jgi:hypothetical protein